MEIFWGKVTTGAKRGKSLGFPTANIAMHKNIAEGIYMAKVTIHAPSVNRHPERSEGSNSMYKILRSTQNDKKYNALTFIGKAETFDQTEVKAESYLLDFSGNLYGRYITVQLVKKIRENKKFTSADALVKQMKQDEVAAREFFAE